MAINAPHSRMSSYIVAPHTVSEKELREVAADISASFEDALCAVGEASRDLALECPVATLAPIREAARVQTPPKRGAVCSAGFVPGTAL